MQNKPANTPPKGSDSGILWLVAIVGGLIFLTNVSKCSPDSSDGSAAEVAASSPTIKTLSAAVAAQTPPAVQPLNAGSVSTGVADMRKAVDAEGLSGAMIYSQNCYDALAKTFSWQQLDICGAADVRAVAAVPEDDIVGMEKEIAYFQSEIAAARYLGATTGAGESATLADERLANIQAKVPQQKRAKLPTVEDNQNVSSSVRGSNEPMNVDVAIDTE